MSVNLNILFHYVADKLDKRGLDSNEQKRRDETEYTALSNSYFGALPINYNNIDLMLAYTRFYAPKHAVIWRDYFASFRPMEGDIELNLLGCGPAPELFGLLEGIRWNKPGKVVVHAYDINPRWEEFVRFGCDVYGKKLKLDIEVDFATDASVCVPGKLVLGSFIITDMIRSGEASKFDTYIPKGRPAEVILMDCPLYTGKDGCGATSNHLKGYSRYQYDAQKAINCLEIEKNEFRHKRYGRNRSCYAVPRNPGFEVYSRRVGV